MMKAIKVKDSVCCNCGRFTQYYDKCVHNYYACGYGLCNAKNKIVKEADTCNCFLKKEKGRVSAKEVEAAISAVNQLKELL